jgi:hypothetical protein
MTAKKSSSPDDDEAYAQWALDTGPGGGLDPNEPGISAAEKRARKRIDAQRAEQQDTDYAFQQLQEESDSRQRQAEREVEEQRQDELGLDE